MEQTKRTVKTSDLYEGTFYVLQGCKLINQECTHAGNQISCFMEFAGESLLQLQASYFSGQSQVNLFDFRRQYGYLSALVTQARRKYKNMLKNNIPPDQHTYRDDEGGNR